MKRKNLKCPNCGKYTLFYNRIDGKYYCENSECNSFFVIVSAEPLNIEVFENPMNAPLMCKLSNRAWVSESGKFALHNEIAKMISKKASSRFTIIRGDKY